MNYDDWLVHQEHEFRGWNTPDYECMHCEKPIDKKGFPYEWQVTRVASGWIYQDTNPKTTVVSQFFVPFDNSFQNK